MLLRGDLQDSFPISNFFPNLTSQDLQEGDHSVCMLCESCASALGTEGRHMAVERTDTLREYLKEFNGET